MTAGSLRGSTTSWSTASQSELQISARQPLSSDQLPKQRSDIGAVVINPSLAPLAAQLSVLLIAAGVLICVLAALAQAVHR